MSLDGFKILCAVATLWAVAFRCIAATLAVGTKKGLSPGAIISDERTTGIEDWVRHISYPQVAEVASRVFTVDKSGAPGCYSSVQAAVDDVPEGNTQRITIRIGAGMFHEKVRVPIAKALITFDGAGKDFTTIAWDDTVHRAGSVEHSATVSVDSKGFIARGLTIQNTAPAPPPGHTEDLQAVALKLSGDQAAFYDCNIIGAQDTVYDDDGRHYFENCFIRGPVKFICGNGQSLYKGCQLEAVARGAAAVNQRRMSSIQETGFSFVDCSVTSSRVLYLGSVWGPFSRVVFSYTNLDSNSNFQPKSWFNWRFWKAHTYDSQPFVYIT